jgi:allantoinase
VRLHLYHLSCARSVDLAQMYRRQGVSVTTETCPHYLIFSEENMDSLGARIRINPPVRTKADKSMLWQKIRSGEIDCVSSDHAPWPIERKNKESIFDNASGCPGVETLLPLMYSEGVTGGHISLSALARVVSETPARTFGLFPGKGALLPGSDADLVILDPEKRWTVRSEEMNSSAGWTPYEGMEVKGKVETTVVRGEIVFSQGELLGKKGSGRFVKPVNAQKAQRDGEH